MRITSKGQVTIPQTIREQMGFFPSTEVEFEITQAGVLLKKKEGSDSFGVRLVQRMRGLSNTKMTTDQIMALTRGSDVVSD